MPKALYGHSAVPFGKDVAVLGGRDSYNKTSTLFNLEGVMEVTLATVLTKQAVPNTYLEA